jgi:beta-phosphoglucomutase
MAFSLLDKKAVIFDMDGVITNTMPDHYKAWKKVLKEEGIIVDKFEIYRREGQKGIDSVREIFIKYQKPSNNETILRLLREKENYFNRNAKVLFISGARKFIDDLYKNKFQLGLVTGTSFPEVKKILPASTFNKFSAIITSSNVKNGKPHPEPYIKALKALKIKSTDAIVIENAPLGIESAKRAGILCIGLETSLPKRYLRQADVICTSIKQLRTKLRF